MQYLELFSALHLQQVRYLICGGLAVNIYGIPRMTADIDLLLGFDENNLERFGKVTEQLLFRSHIPVELNALLDEGKRLEIIKSKNLVAYSFYNETANYMNLDVLIDVPFSFKKLWEERETRKVKDFEIQIVSLENLIAMKKYANRHQDKQDILMLSRLRDLR